MDFIEQLTACIPASPDAEIPWNKLDQLFAASLFSNMRATAQNPSYHAEGDVYVHTQMVCCALIGGSVFPQLPARQQSELFLAALLHDIGKVKTTRLEDGSWVSPHHASTGSQMAREFLWQACGLCGTPEKIAFRETVCALIRYHMLPVHLMDRNNPERKLREVAAIGELAGDFSWRLLCLLAQADVKGRIVDGIEERLAKVELAGLMAEDTDCLDSPYPFADAFTKRAYLSGRKVQPDQTLYDTSWGEVILLSGLPGTGKDTWARRQHAGLPMVSLDDFRAELAIQPTQQQGAVLQAALEQARAYLRNKQPFLWNATNLTKDTRQRLIGLFERYGARVRVVYLETEWETREARNAGRPDAVPEGAVARMLGKTVLPTPDEAQTVEWLCI